MWEHAQIIKVITLTIEKSVNRNSPPKNSPQKAIRHRVAVRVCASR